MFNRINEGFERKYQPLTEAKVSDAEMLRKLLTATANSMLRAGNNNLKAYEIAFQDDVERFFPGMCWWEVTTCNIFNELFNTRDPLAVVDCIIANLTDEFKEGGLNDVLGNTVDQAETAIKGIVDESKSLNEEPEVTFDEKDLFDPKSISLKGMAQKAVDKEKAEIAEKERQERIAAAKEKYKDVLDGIADMSTDDAMEKLHQALVPNRGKADTVAGELVRATMRILYRDYNDGDKFFMGYGLETCGGSAQYLMDMGMSSIKEILNDVYKYVDDDDAYTTAITSLAKEVINQIISNPYLLSEPNTTDSRDYPCDGIEESQPDFDYDFNLPYEVQKYMDAGHINYTDVEAVIESNLDGNSIKYSSIDCGSDYVYIYGLDCDGYEEVQGWRMYDESYWEYELREWEDEYGDPDEDDEDDDDIDESKSLKESPMYDMTPQYDNRKSFYSKARVDDNGNEKTLYSYNTPVAKIADGKVELLPKWDWSQTTLRHVKEFLKQNGFEATSLAQMRKDYL